MSGAWISRLWARKIIAVCAIGAAVVAAYLATALCWSSPPESEVTLLATVLRLKPGMTVAEIGAGTGDMTRRVAEKVGPSGHVFSTEIDPKRIGQIHKAIEKQRLTNVTVITGSEAETGLPAQCCDAIFLRDVYHHFTHPVEMNRSVFRSLRPGGLLVVIDFPPRWYLRLWQPKGVPKNRGGHGIAQKMLIEEVTNAGLHVERVVDNWPGRTYCVVFRKPLP